MWRWEYILDQVRYFYDIKNKTNIEIPKKKATFTDHSSFIIMFIAFYAKAQKFNINFIAENYGQYTS